MTIESGESDHLPAPDRTSIVELEVATRPVEPPAPTVLAETDDLELIWRALVTGTKDYVEKNRFASVILGLSGGIDSSVCAAIAVDAFGPERVYGVSMPSQYSSAHSKTDADELAERLGIAYRVEPVAELVRPFDEQLRLTGLAAENVQSRVRGVVLMSLSNLEGHLVLTTGNKSELAVGYSTIYGDSPRLKTYQRRWFGNWLSGAMPRRKRPDRLPRFRRDPLRSHQALNYGQTRPTRTASPTTRFSTRSSNCSSWRDWTTRKL